MPGTEHEPALILNWTALGTWPQGAVFLRLSSFSGMSGSKTPSKGAFTQLCFDPFAAERDIIWALLFLFASLSKTRPTTGIFFFFSSKSHVGRRPTFLAWPSIPRILLYPGIAHMIHEICIRWYQSFPRRYCGLPRFPPFPSEGWKIKEIRGTKCSGYESNWTQRKAF